MPKMLKLLAGLALLSGVLANPVPPPTLKITGLSCDYGGRGDNGAGHTFAAVVAIEAPPGRLVHAAVSSERGETAFPTCVEETLSGLASTGQTDKERADAAGKLKLRFGVQSCDTLYVQAFYSEFLNSGGCVTTPVTALDPVMGVTIVLELSQPMTKKEIARTLASRIESKTLEPLNKHNHLADTMIVKLHGAPTEMAQQWTVDGETPAEPAPGTGFATVSIPSMNTFEAGTEELRHIRNQFFDLDDKKGQARRASGQFKLSRHGRKTLGHIDDIFFNLLNSFLTRVGPRGALPVCLTCVEWGGSKMMVDCNCDMTLSHPSGGTCGQWDGACQDDGASGSTSKTLSEVNQYNDWTGDDKVLCDGGSLDGNNAVFFITHAACENFALEMNDRIDEFDRTNRDTVTCLEGKDMGYSEFPGGVAVECSIDLIWALTRGTYSGWIYYITVVYPIMVGIMG